MGPELGPSIGTCFRKQAGAEIHGSHAGDSSKPENEPLRSLDVRRTQSTLSKLSNEAKSSLVCSIQSNIPFIETWTNATARVGWASPTSARSPRHGRAL